MKTININFCGFWNSFNYNDNLFTRLLSKHFDVKISDKPDFVICSNRGKPFEYMKYDCVRIMFMGENMSLDFTVFDYGIGFDFLDFGERYFRLPFAFYNDNGDAWVPEELTEDQAREILNEKKYFCNFIYGHASSRGLREKIFEALNEYKLVVSPGNYLNNLEGKSARRCSWKEKFEYLKYSKFTIAGDSIQYPGFVTEKIVQPFQWHSIPIYCGSPLIDKDFNVDSFIWVKNEADIERTLEKVSYLDSHDDAYIHMLTQCPLHRRTYLEERYEELEKFLVNIFKQEPVKAFRRVRYFCAERHERYLKEYAERYAKTPELIRIIKNKFGA